MRCYLILEQLTKAVIQKRSRGHLEVTGDGVCLWPLNRLLIFSMLWSESPNSE
jgi:hypothetical protein